MVRICNRCNREHLEGNLGCPCGAPEFRVYVRLQHLEAALSMLQALRDALQQITDEPERGPYIARQALERVPGG